VSNVLIGIIGVILFIGLALAGALFLGERFSEASINSDAAIVSNNLKQMADAARMMATQEGRTMMEHDHTLLVGGGYLKALPKNHLYPSSNQEQHTYQLSYNGENPNAPRGLEAHYVVLFLYDGTLAGDAKMTKICEAIARQSGQSAPSWDGASGCAPYAGRWIAFQKL
jgi:hypothetical protein